MSEIKNVGWTRMALNTFKCNYLTPLHFKGLMHHVFSVRRVVLAASNNEQIIVAVQHGDRPPLSDITGPADLVSFAAKWISLSWHQQADQRPTFAGKHCCSHSHRCNSQCSLSFGILSLTCTL